MGIQGKVSLNKLTRANENRGWRIYFDFAQILVHEARCLYTDEDFGLELEETVYALDSSTIDLCLSVFHLAHFRKTKSDIKLHKLLDLSGILSHLLLYPMVKYIHYYTHKHFFAFSV